MCPSCLLKTCSDHVAEEAVELEDELFLSTPKASSGSSGRVCQCSSSPNPGHPKTVQGSRTGFILLSLIVYDICDLDRGRLDPFGLRVHECHYLPVAPYHPEGTQGKLFIHCFDPRTIEIVIVKTRL